MFVLSLNGVWKVLPDKDSKVNASEVSDPNHDTSKWFDIKVPGHWQDELNELRNYAGVVWYRKEFDMPDYDGKIWLVFHGVFYRTRVWLNGEYLGEHSGYFSPFKFDVTKVIKRGKNVLVVRVESYDEKDINKKKQVGGVFYHWDCRDPTFNPGGIWRSVEIHSTGKVWFERIKIIPTIYGDYAKLRIILWLGSEHNGKAGINLRIEPKNFDGEPIDHEIEVFTSPGINRFETGIDVKDPKLWWTWDLGKPNLYKLYARAITNGSISDEKEIVFGIKEVKLVRKHSRWTFYLNGKRIFLRGTNYGPTDQRIGKVDRSRIELDARLMRQANINAVRIHAHVNPLAWQVFDEYGILVWQDMPLQWSYDKSIENDALSNAKELVYLSENHASVAIYCAHNEPVIYPDPSSIRRTFLAFLIGLAFSIFLGSIGLKVGMPLVSGVWKDILLILDKDILGIRLAWLISIALLLIAMFPAFALLFGGIEAMVYLVILGIILPWDAALVWITLLFILRSPLTALTYNWNKSVLDKKIAKILKSEDMGVHIVIEHSGELGWFINGTDTHIYDGWYTGWFTIFPWLRGYKHIKTLVGPFKAPLRLVSEFGFQAFPKVENSLKMLPQEIAEALQKDFRKAYPKAAKHLKVYNQYQPEFMKFWVNFKKFSSVDEFVEETQEKQAELMKFYIEFLRARKYNPVGGIFQFMFTDIAPLVTWAIIDYWRESKKAYHLLCDLYSPIFIAMDWPEVIKSGKKCQTKVYLINDLHENFEGTLTVKINDKEVFSQKVVLQADSVNVVPVILKTFGGGNVAKIVLELNVGNYGVVKNWRRVIIK
ncbi:MAG: beta galactosidase jelly roll domain-containing protein [Crenarchaeota archaeon]|nr:beta galactosidase jelly roll domain-containing protein [Thermoproteota archaeon]